MASLIGALRVSLSADTASFEEGMARAKKGARSAASEISRAFSKDLGIGSAIKGLVAGLTVGTFAGLVKQGLEYAGSLAEVAQQLGVTAKDLQVFRYAAGQVGVSQDELETGLSKLTITLGKVAVGAKEPAKALAAIGISVDQVKGKDTGTVFRMIADSLGKVTDRAQRASVEVALFGKTGSKLDNLLSGGTGALNELTNAAEKLGIVLSDEQIANADNTADKLEALKTVLSANIASAVANNTGAIMALANSLVWLLQKTGEAVQGWRILYAEFSTPINWKLGIVGSMDKARKDLLAQQNNDSLAGHFAQIRAGSQRVPTGSPVGQFLAPPAPKPKMEREDHTAENQLREQYRAASEQSRAEIDVLNAKRDLAKDYVARTSISIQIKNKEQEAYYAELAYNVALNGLTKGKDGMTAAQAGVLKALYDQKDALERQAILDDEQEQRQKDVQQLTEHDFDRRRDILDSQSAIAETAAERRKVELEILRLAYEQKRQALQNTIDTSKNEAEVEDARRDLLNLNKTYGNDRTRVMQQTRGPLEEWAASVPHDAATITEALQSIEANGLDGLSEAIAGVVTGTESLKKAFGSMAQSILTDIIKISIRMLVFRAISGIFPSAFGGSSTAVSASTASWNGNVMSPITFGTPLAGVAPLKYAFGGGFTVMGNSGVDKNLLSINGLPIANVSHGERVDIANDNAGNGVGSGGRLIVELRDDMLDARIADGAQVQIVRSYPGIQAGVSQSIKERNRRA